MDREIYSHLWYCPFCDFQNDDKGEMRDHITEEHIPSPNNPYLQVVDLDKLDKFLKNKLAQSNHQLLEELREWVEELEEVTHNGRGTILWEVDEIAKKIKDFKDYLDSKEGLTSKEGEK